ncbi:hypothetical protein BpHYR1_021830 [Brachionus plicatilis]|uniref:Uncharacterized protein n=1 Tax=Brachionus plicatilis TaxID=10195 RepID=A0A3M7T404_BRAPC|nr:hypothetical protein BpHYR1_021830 [Brachionus plicatilis]
MFVQVKSTLRKNHALRILWNYLLKQQKSLKGLAFKTLKMLGRKAVTSLLLIKIYKNSKKIKSLVQDKK